MNDKTTFHATIGFMVLLLCAIWVFVVPNAMRRHEDGGGAPARGTWVDAPGSNAYGPRTGVVWTDGVGGDTYHRVGCPRLPSADRVPRARALVADLELVPCGICEGSDDE